MTAAAACIAVLGWLVAAACAGVLVGMWLKSCDHDVWDDAAYLRDCPGEPSDAEVERRFARIVGWVQP